MENEHLSVKVTLYLDRMKNDRVRSATLVESLDREIKALELHGKSIEPGELSILCKETVSHLKGIYRTLTDWIAEFDEELVRVQEAIDGLENDDIHEVKKAFQKFVLEDTAFSVRNVSMMFYDFDRIIQEAKLFYEDK